MSSDPRHAEYDRLHREVLEEAITGDVDSAEYRQKRRRMEQLRRELNIGTEDPGDDIEGYIS